MIATPDSGSSEYVVDNTKVICPACCNQFRAIPVQVQRLLLDAGIDPPFLEPAHPPAALPKTPGDPKLYDWMRREITDAIYAAEHPSGMSTHDGMVKIKYDTLVRLFDIARYPARPALPDGWLSKALSLVDRYVSASIRSETSDGGNGGRLDRATDAALDDLLAHLKRAAP